MSTLQFICGASGSGKSSYAFDRVVALSEEEPEKNFLIVVPEQFTMATQRELVRRYPGHAIMNIDVLSFDRLAFRVFDDLGKTDLAILEETGKNLVLRKVAQERAAELPMLGRNMRRMGYVTELKSLISEFLQYRVTPETLRSLTEADETAFSYKLRDIATIYEGFLSALSGSYITAEEVLTVLIDLADQSELLRNSVLIFDGFTGFTPIQNEVLTKIFPLISEALVAVTIDTRVDILKSPTLTDLFYMSEKMIHSLLQIAETTGTEVLPPILLGDADGKRYQDAPPLHFLERNLFRKRPEIYPDEPRSLSLVSLPDPREELVYAAAEIRRLVRTEGYRYRDFAIVTGELETYANYAEEVFRDFDVPVFLDRTNAILFSPLTELLRSALEVLSMRYSAESVFFCLRTGLTGIEREDIDLLENYVLSRGIRGSRWKERFLVLPDGKGEDELEKLNALRERVVKLFAPLEDAFLGEPKTAEAECRALYEWLLSLDVEEKLRQASERFSEAGDEAKAREFEEIYGIVIDLIDKIATLLSDEALTAEEFSEILDAGFEAADVGIIPPGYDRVTLGDIERTRLSDIKGLFFVGVNDGVIPSNTSGAGIISELERERFADAGIELAPSGKERAFIQKFYLYMNLTKPSERLTLSYARVDSEGGSIRPSYLISVLTRLFPKLTVTEPEEKAYLLETPESARQFFLRELPNVRTGAECREWDALFRWYAKNERYQKFVSTMMDAAFFTHEPERISRETARALYGAILRNSVTRLEQYASCAFSHFLRYGLGLTERELHEFSAPDLGSVYHDALYRFGEKLTERGLSWATLPEEKLNAISDESLSEAVLASKVGEFFADAKGKFDYERMCRILRRSVSVMSDQLRAGRFTPEAYEVGFGGAERLDSTEFSLSPEEKMLLLGRIDRLDTYADGDDIYVKVIDYKSGGTTYDLLGIYEGLSLQLVVYLNVAEELTARRHQGKTVRPGGIFYYHLDDPLFKLDEELSDEELQSEIRKTLRPDGVANEDDAAVAAFDEQLSDRNFTATSEVIRARRKKDGGFDSNSRVMSEEDFSVTKRFTERRLLDFGREIVDGEIAVNPYRRKDKDACAYCDYRSVCGIDERLSGYEYREIADKSKEEILTAMREEIARE